MDYCILLLFLLVGLTSSQESPWKEPYFIDPQNGIVIFGDVQGDYQMISMEEDKEPNITLMYLNYKDKDTTPSIIRFDEGIQDMMGPVFEYDEKKQMWCLLITNKIDYEILTGRKRFMVSIAVQGLVKKFILNIINIDNKPPVVEIQTYPCQIEENFVGESECTYKLSDPDGWLHYMKFTIIGTKDEEKLFKFEYKDSASIVNTTNSAIVKLHTIQPLDFENISIYLFDWYVEDSGGNNVTTKILVKVIDMPDMPPRWTNIFATQQFDEKIPQEFQVTAIDGDIEVNAEINYKLNSTWNDLFNINTETGVITIPKGIDRDALQQEIFTFVVIAYEKDDPEWEANQTVSFLVDDVNDNAPTIDTTNTTIWGEDRTLKFVLEENKITPLDVLIQIEDRDLGENAMYGVSLIDEITNMYTKPFQIVPTRGYQQGNFSLAIVNSSLLDYEEEEWQQFKFQIFALENLDENHHDRVWVQIELINWNDELPIFNQTEYTFEVPENIPADKFVAQVYATDRDIGDHVEYELLGTVNNILQIGTLTGEVRTIKDNAFDYERQTQHIIQVQAQDNLNDTHHQTYAQLTINILDVNDETPRIQVPTTIRVEENRPNGYLITDKVTATDEDTTAHLQFDIEWGTSYATKNGQIVQKDFEIYIESVYVDTVNISTNPTGYARADLKIEEKVPKNTPDYEIFDTLYLNLTVTDLNQEINEGSAWVLLTINIIDLNDNPPIFVESTITKNYTVLDKALTNSAIGTITAIDPDGPPYNNVSYFIRPVDKDTPEGWIAIDQLTGALTVVSNQISADLPPKWYLKYTIHATDSELFSEANIAVYIIDVNNQKPKLKTIEEVVYIKEKSAVGTIGETKITCEDADRDAPFNVVWYRFGQPNINVTEYFRIDYTSGDIIVNNPNLDRDYGIQEFTVDLEYVDNYEGRPVEQLFDRTSFKIKLLDINDQIPVLETKQVTTKETLKKGEEIPEKITANDADEAGTDNSKIEFSIVTIEKGEEGASKDPPRDLFQIVSDPQVENGVAILKTNYDLEGFYGQYNITVLLNDLGIPRNEKEYSLIVEISKHNFHKPTFIEPDPDKENVYYLSKSNTQSTNQLVLYNNDLLPDIKADDNQGGKWDIKFSIIDAQNNAGDIFYIDNRNNLGRSTGRLLLQSSSFDKNKKYQFTILAKDNGDPTYTTTVEVTIHFFDIDQQPHFDENDRVQTVHFSENTTGLEEFQKIREASFNGIETQIGNLTIYYHLTPSDDSRFFNLDPIEGTITLKEELDYEEQKSHHLQIIASNSDKTQSSDLESKLDLTVEVIDINDNEPYFNSSFYGIITTDNSIDDRVLTVIAYDEDTDDYLTYTIVEGTLEKNGTNINDLTNPFEIKDGRSGDIYLKFKVQQSMNGYFTFVVKAQDKPPESHSATTPVKVFIVNEKHRVEFKFESQLEVVEKKNNTIKEILQGHFGYVANIEKIIPDAAENGEPLSNQTIVITYFIDQNINEPILKEFIINKASDIDEYTQLRASFLEEGMILMGFNTNAAENNQDAALMAWLIGTTVVLGLLCLILLVAFILKTRSLTNRLNNLSSIKFGSQESGINRIGVTAPTTNKHAVEGSNPVFGEEKQMPEIDRRSIASGDSDLIGVEDNPEFDYGPFSKEHNNIDKNHNATTPNDWEKY